MNLPFLLIETLPSTDTVKNIISSVFVKKKN